MSMATVYRDYGTMQNSTLPDNTIEVVSRRQVYRATHDGEGNLLPFMKRSFISFTYGGRYIEDFDLLATIEGDRLEREGYASFNDLTTDYDNLDGQQYWGTHYKTNSITFRLATDGIDQPTLDSFLNWFQAGVSRELILAEHPNRVILARVAEPPQLSLLPFEHHTTFMVSNLERDVITTLYKGEITLHLIMDEPHWHAKDNILGILADKEVDPNESEKRYIDYWIDFNGDSVDIFASADALKILYEDGIPLGSNIQHNMLLGNGTFANIENDYDSKIWDPAEAQIVYTDGEPSGQGARIAGIITDEEFAENSSCIGVEYIKDGEPALQYLTAADDGKLFFDLDSNENPTTHKEFFNYWPREYFGKIAGAIIDITGNGITCLPGLPIDEDAAGYFFYAGTAPSPTKITFTLIPRIADDYYIDVPYNKIDNDYHGEDNRSYNQFIITGEREQILKITTPNLYTSYNRLIKIIEQRYRGSETDWAAMYKDVRDKVRHAAVRAWAARIFDTYQAIMENSSSEYSIQDIKSSLLWFLKDSEGHLYPITLTFNSKTGEAIGYAQYSKLTSIPNSINEISDSIETVESEENIGDMLNSNYIIIKERNYPNESGYVVKWQDTVEGHRYSHKITHDFPIPLTNIQIEYQNMYL